MNMVRIVVADRSALLRWAETARIFSKDTGYLLHAAMRRAFGGYAPQPFVWQEERGEILGYGAAGEGDLRAVLAGNLGENGWLGRAFCLPEPCCKPFPTRWTQGTVLHFRVLACPIRRFKSDGENQPRRTREKDAFLLDLETSRREGRPAPTREESYIGWLTEQMEGRGAASLRACRIRGRRLMNPVRRDRAGHDGPPRPLSGKRPEALFSGELAVNDPEAFAALVARGVGRHRAFGFGMLLLKTGSPC
jgi:CRISPR system Cascade subunit CasE